MAIIIGDPNAGTPPALPLDVADPTVDRYAPPVPAGKPAIGAAPKPETGPKAPTYPLQPTVLPAHGDDLD